MKRIGDIAGKALAVRLLLLAEEKVGLVDPVQDAVLGRRR
jgi:hypothetical protein